MSASAMTNFVRELFKQTEDYQSLTQRIIRERYMKHINVDVLAEDERSLLREIVDIIVKDMIENPTDIKEQQLTAKNDQSEAGHETEKNKNLNQESPEEKSGESCSDLEEDAVKVIQKRKKSKIKDDSDSENSLEGSARDKLNNTDSASPSDSDDSYSEPKGGKRKQSKSSKMASKKPKLSGPSKNTKKPIKKKAVSGIQQTEPSDSETSSIDKKKSKTIKKSENVAKTAIPNSKKNLKKQKLSSSDEELSENEDIDASNKKIFEDSDSDESEPLLTYKEKHKDKAFSKDSMKVDLKNNEDNSSESDDQTLSDVKKLDSKQLSASGDDSDKHHVTSTSSKKLKKSRSSNEEKRKPKEKKNPTPKMAANVDEKDENVKKLEKIARACGVLPVGKRYKMTFETCRSNKERADKLTQMLRDAGMTGKISMKGAEILKLKREATELLNENSNIMSEGRGRRNANNPFSTRTRNRKESSGSDSSSPLHSAKESFSHLKGIVDSEEESD